MRFLFTVIVSSPDATGGIVSSLSNLTGLLLSHGHHVTVLELNGNQALRKKLSNQVELKTLHGKAKYWNIGIEQFKQAQGIKKLMYLGIGVWKKVLCHFNAWERFIFSEMPIEEYDVAVAFRQSSFLNYIVTRKVKSGATIAFMHSEIDGNTAGWMPFLKDIDYIACVSNDWGNRFKQLYPALEGKVRTVYNLFDAKGIGEMAEQSASPYDDPYFNIVTVARIETSQKKIELIPEIYSAIQSKTQKKIRWYIVGDGPSRFLVEQAIQRTHTENDVFMLGAKNNPFPYIKNADLFVLTSSWESYGMVIVESLILGVPVVAGDYPALHEIISDEDCGIIANNSVEGIADSILRVVNDKNLYATLKENCRHFEYKPDAVYKQFIEICNQNLEGGESI